MITGDMSTSRYVCVSPARVQGVGFMRICVARCVFPKGLHGFMQDLLSGCGVELFPCTLLNVSVFSQRRRDINPAAVTF